MYARQRVRHARHAAQLAIDYAPTARWQLGATANVSGPVFANDVNSERAAGFAVLGLHAAYGWGCQQAGSGAGAGTARWQLWARLDNVFNRHHAATLIVNDANGRYFEPAAGRRLMVGLRAQFM